MAKRKERTPEAPTEQIVFWTFWLRHRPDVKEWHITGNEEGVTAMRSALQSIAPERNAVKTIALADMPDAVKIAGNKRKAKLGAILTLRYVADAPECFNIVENEDNITFEFGEMYRQKLIEGMNDILNERGNYDIGTDTVRLNFWWWTLNS